MVCFCRNIKLNATYLCLGEHEAGGDLKALGSGEVLVLPELFFQLEQLLAGEGCPGSPGFSEQCMLRSTCNTKPARARFYLRDTPQHIQMVLISAVINLRPLCQPGYTSAQANARAREEDTLAWHQPLIRSTARLP